MKPIIKKVNLARLSSGDELGLQLYQFVGNHPGEKIYIQANLHGAEIVGNVVINELFHWLSQLEADQLAGEIWLVPACNPLGMNQRSHFFSPGRFNSYDGVDWNRIFWNYEQQHSHQIETFAQQYLNAPRETIYKDYLQTIQNAFDQQKQFKDYASSVPYWCHYRNCLQSLCLDAQHVIDIHSSSNQGINFFFGFPGRTEQAKSFLLDIGILVEQPEGLTFDEAFINPWLSLEKAFANRGRSINFDLASWTLELGSGMTANQQSVATGVQGIKNYLAQQHVVDVAKFPLAETNHHNITWVNKKQIKKYYAPTGGIIQSYPPLKSNVVAKETIYQLLQFNKESGEPELIEVTAEESGIIFDVGTNQAVNEGEYVLSVLEL